MKKELAVFALTLSLASTGAAFANEESTTTAVANEEGTVPQNQPVKMTEEQLDEVAGGQIGQLVGINVVAVDVVDVEDVNVNANAAAAVAVLGGAAAGAVQFIPRQ